MTVPVYVAVSLLLGNHFVVSVSEELRCLTEFTYIYTVSTPGAKTNSQATVDKI